MADDPEIAAMASVASALEPLDQEARARVLGWAASRYAVSIPKPGSPAKPGSPGGTQDSTGAEPGEFANFADLYDAAHPSTDAERALVSAYWMQVVQGNADFTAQPVNTALKNLGHPLSNVTDALTSLKSRKPSLVLQLEKHGKARQGRKTYKLTTAGERAVAKMLSGKGEEAEE